MKNILFVFGGRSCESDVSVLTGLLAMSAADGEKYNAVPLYISASGEFFTGDKLKSLETFKNADGDFSKVAVKATFVPPDKAVYTIRKGKLIRGEVISAIVDCCHGGAGEDGSLSGYFAFFGVPVCSPGVLAGAVSMDKAATKTFLKAIGVLTPDFIKVPAIEDRDEAVKTVKKRLGYPVIVKPLTLGSSVGIGVALNEAELNERMNYAYRFDDTVIVVAEHFEAQKDIAYHSAAIKKISDFLGWKTDKYGRIEALIDSAANQHTLAASKSVTELFFEHGIAVNPKVNKDMFAGIARVKEYFSLGEITGADDDLTADTSGNAAGEYAKIKKSQKPRILIFDNCVNLIRELKTYRFCGGDSPIKSDDHLLDALRYYLMTRPSKRTIKTEKTVIEKDKERLYKKIRYERTKKTVGNQKSHRV